MHNIQYPVPYQKIPSIEIQTNIWINVFGFENNQITLLCISKREDLNEDLINVLLLALGQNQHYVLIRNFSRLLGIRKKHDGKQWYYSYRCLHDFSRNDLLQEHVQFCIKQVTQIVEMPTEKIILLKFTAIHMQHTIVYAIYGDFESLLVPIDFVTKSHNLSFTEKTNIAYPLWVCLCSIRPDGTTLKNQGLELYRWEDIVDDFLRKIMVEMEVLGNQLFKIQPM